MARTKLSHVHIPGLAPCMLFAHELPRTLPTNSIPSSLSQPLITQHQIGSCRCVVLKPHLPSQSGYTQSWLQTQSMCSGLLRNTLRTKPNQLSLHTRPCSCCSAPLLAQPEECYNLISDTHPIKIHTQESYHKNTKNVKGQDSMLYPNLLVL